MSTLPTPPRTSHRDKENVVPVASTSRVVWSATNQIHDLSATPKKGSSFSTSALHPTKSILKSVPALAPLLDTGNQRESTPEPSLPMTNETYLQSSVSMIIDPSSTLSDLIEGYCRLAARLRQCAGDDALPSSSWPLFEPLRTHRDALVACMSRDLERALEDPLLETTAAIDTAKMSMLPSPMKSPRKKRSGMSGEQAKQARDVLTICLSVMRLLMVILPTSGIYRVFTDDHLHTLISSVVSIPCALDLPIMNARKACAMSICTIQTQRLPACVLGRLPGRIALALRRGIEGELGKDGKKGSVSDGLKAVHDLSLYQPSTFIPAFLPILPTLLSSLLSGLMNVRALACFALSGFAYGSTQIPTSETHIEMARTIAKCLTHNPKPSPTKDGSPGVNVETPVVRTLRTTINATSFSAAAGGPIWAITVLSSFMVMLGPTLCSNAKISKIVSNVTALALKHKNSVVRMVACIAWRCTTWAYFQQPFPQTPIAKIYGQTQEDVREKWWSVIQSKVDLGAGTTAIGALLGSEHPSTEDMSRMMSILRLMLTKNVQNVPEAMHILQRLVSFETSNMDWRSSETLPAGLFSSYPGLLVSDLTALHEPVKQLCHQLPHADSLRSLTMEELTNDGLLATLFASWADGLRAIDWHSTDRDTFNATAKAWSKLIEADIKVTRELGKDTQDAADRAVQILIDIIEDPNRNWTLPTETPKTATASVQRSSSSGFIVITKLLRHLWDSLAEIIPHHHLVGPGRQLVWCLMNNQDELTHTMLQPMKSWTALVSTVLLVCDTDTFKMFWGYHGSADGEAWKWDWPQSIQSCVWGQFAEKWKNNDDVTWEHITIILGVPFVFGDALEVDENDCKLWQNLLEHGVCKGQDAGVDAMTFIEEVAQIATTHYKSNMTSAVLFADMLLSELDQVMEEVVNLPRNLLLYVNETLRTIYPPEQGHKQACLWMLRSLVPIVDHCPSELFHSLLETIQEGMSYWIADSSNSFPGSEYDDILTLYEMTLLKMRALPRDSETMTSFSLVLEAGLDNRSTSRAPTIEVFTEFWEYMFSDVEKDEWPASVRACFGISSPEEQPTTDIVRACTPPPTSSLPLLSPSTPHHIPSRPSTPPRPHKMHHAFVLPCSPASPTKRFSPPNSHLPLAASPVSPSKRRKLSHNKENEAPATVLERLEKINTGKRRMSRGEEGNASPKRPKFDDSMMTLTLSDDSVIEVEEVEDILRDCQPEAGPSRIAVPLRRKRHILEAVEMPARRFGKRRAEEPTLARTIDVTTTPTTIRVVKRQSGETLDEHSKTPASKMLSSDDDPHLGQVTPHHLISPAMHRHKRTRSVDSSDDESDVGTSPTRDLVRRRLERKSSRQSFVLQRRHT